MLYIDAEITGTYALMCYKFGAEQLDSLSTRTTKKAVTIQKTPREIAESYLYTIKGSDAFWFPTNAIIASIREAGGDHKQRGSRKSMKTVVPAAVRAEEEFVKIIDPKTGRQHTTWEVDVRRAVNPTTRGAVACFRPRFDQWALRFRLSIFEDLVDPATVQQLLTEAGQRYGIGSYRPQKMGPFGVFRVTRWEELKADQAA